MNPRLTRATFCFDRGDFVAAEAELRAAQAEGDDSAELHALIGLCLLESQLKDRARSEVETALQRRPDCAYAHYAMSFVQQASLEYFTVPLFRDTFQQWESLWVLLLLFGPTVPLGVAVERYKKRELARRHDSAVETLLKNKDSDTRV